MTPSLITPKVCSGSCRPSPARCHGPSLLGSALTSQLQSQRAACRLCSLGFNIKFIERAAFLNDFAVTLAHNLIAARCARDPRRRDVNCSAGTSGRFRVTVRDRQLTERRPLQRLTSRTVPMMRERPVYHHTTHTAEQKNALYHNARGHAPCTCVRAHLCQ